MEPIKHVAEEAKSKDRMFRIVNNIPSKASAGPVKHFILFDTKTPVWGKIKQTLIKLTKETSLTVALVLDYLDTIYKLKSNSKDASIEQFFALKKFMEHNLPEKPEAGLEVFASIAKLALKIEEYFPDGRLPLIYSSQTCVISRKIAASLLAAGFLGVYPPQSIKELPNPQDFYYFFRANLPLMQEKLKFYAHYFKTVCKSEPKGVMQITRFSLSPEVVHSTGFFRECPIPLNEVELVHNKGIEQIPNAAMVDFANKYLGGGCMKKGAVQEEILFLIFPELYVARMMNVAMRDQDAIIVKGVQRFASYSGYQAGCKFSGAYADTLADALKKEDDCIDRTIIAIDALRFASTKSCLDQLIKPVIDRELKKAMAGFMPLNAEKLPIATGRWGCGAFNGSSQLKFLIQWIAASCCGRKMVFCTFKDKALSEIEAVLKKYTGKPVNLLYKTIIEVGKNYIKKNGARILGKLTMPKEFDTFIFDSIIAGH